MPVYKQREATTPLEIDQNEILLSVVAERGISYDIEQSAKKAMRAASKRQGEAFDQRMSREKARLLGKNERRIQKYLQIV